MSGIPIQGTLYESGVGAPLARLDNIPEMVWDGTILFSTIYNNCNISTLTNGVVIILKGTGHIIDNKGSIYTNMDEIIFTSLDSAKTINIAQGVTFDAQPKLKDNVTLQSQSTATICTNISSTYIGINCALQCDSSVTGAKFISLSGGTTSCTIYMLNGRISNAGVIAMATSAHLQLEMYVASYLDGTSISGSSGNVIVYSDNTCNIPYKSGFVNYTGSLLYAFNGDANLLKDASIISWNGLIAFSDFYKTQNISTLTGSLIINLTGTGHTIDNLGATYTNMKDIAFQSLDSVRTINIAQSTIIDNVPTLINGVILQSQSTSSICTNPTSVINVGFGCTLACYSGVSGAKFVSLTTTHSATCFLNSGTFSGIEVFQLANTSSLHVAALNISDIDANSIYGVSGTNLYLNYDAGSVIPSPADFSNFAGTVHYLTMASSSKIQGGELQLANLAALNAWPFTSQLVVGQWGCAQDTGKKYILTSISPVTWVEYTPAVGSVAFSAITGDPYDNAVLATDLNLKTDTQVTGQLNPEANNWYFENIIIQAADSENAVPLKVLDTIPSGATEYDASIVVNSVTPVIHAAFISPNTQNYMAGFKAGITALKIWAKVSAATATTYIQVNAMQQHTYTGLTVSVAGSGTTRTVTATDTVFVTGDANPDPTIASHLGTPKGRYRIIGIVGASPSNQCLILVPSGYGNESTVAFSKYSKIYQMTSGNITNTSDLQEITCFSNPQLEFSPGNSNWFWSKQISSDKISFWVFGVTDSVPNITITLAYNGWTTCSHVETPAALMVKLLPTQTDHDSSHGGHRVNTITVVTPVAFPMNFDLPDDCYQLLDAQILFYTNGALSNANIDLTTYYTNDPNGAINEYSSTDTSTTYNLIGADLLNRISFTPLLPSIIAGASGSIVATFNDNDVIYYITQTNMYYISY